MGRGILLARAPLRGEPCRHRRSIDIEELKRAQHELNQLKDQLHNKNIALRAGITETSIFEEIIGNSEPLRGVLALGETVASTNSTVLMPPRLRVQGSLECRASRPLLLGPSTSPIGTR